MGTSLASELILAGSHMDAHTSIAYCPTCFEAIDIPVPPPTEVPIEVDYDCHVCCNPMVVQFFTGAQLGEVLAEAHGIGD